MRTIIEGGTIVNEGRTFDGSIIIEDGTIVGLVPLDQLEELEKLVPLEN